MAGRSCWYTGLPGNRNDFRDHYDALARIGRTIVYDHRGHGDSTNDGNSEAYCFDQLVRDLDGLLTALDVEQCDLLGHSMGGMVALRYVLGHSQRVASLVLMDTSARAPDGFRREVFEAGGSLARSEGMAALAELAKEMAQNDPNRTAASIAYEAQIGNEAYWIRHRQRMGAMDPHAFGALGVEMNDQQPLTDELGAIDCPTTILVGEQDKPFLRPAEELEQGIRGSVRVVIPNAAHSPQLENPKAWFAAIRDHLERVR